VYDQSPTEVKVTEVNAASPRVFSGVLAELARLAIEKRCGHFELHGARDHRFARYLRRCGCRVQSDYPRMGNGMMRVLNQDSLLEKLLPAMEERLALSAFRDVRVRLAFETDLGASELLLGAGGKGTDLNVRLVLCQDQLMQLVAGYRRADDVVSEENVHASEGAEPVLDVLFGGQEPYVWQSDRF
jgi:hypothetical protein